MMPTDQSKYYNPDRGPDLRKTGRHKTPRRNLLPGQSNAWSVSDMWEIHHESKRLMLLGWKNVDIAKKLGITPQSVSQHRNSPIVQEELALMVKARDADAIDVAKEIEKFAPKALNILKDVINAEGEGESATISLRAKSAESWLDRAGHGAINKNHSVVAYLTKEEIEEMKDKAFRNSEEPKVASG